MSIIGKLGQYGVGIKASGEMTLNGNIYARNLIRPPGSVWYVDASVSASGHGRTWTGAKKTITEAYNKCSAFDTIAIAAGDYDEGAAITIALQGIKLIGVNTSGFHHSVMLLGSAATHELIIVKAHNVEIANIGMTQTKAREAIQIGDDAAQAWWKCHIHHCRFDGYGTGTYGVASGGGGATSDAPEMCIEHNHFREFATAAVKMYWTRCMVRNNTIVVPAAGIGIEYVPTTGNRPDGMILDNYIQGSDSTDTGIKFTGTPTKGTYMVAGNFVAGCNTSITQKANHAYGSINNYAATDAGGALIDTTS